jgi:site-specific recombinase XerD
MKDNNQLLAAYLTFLEKVRNLSYLSIDRNKHVCMHWMEFLKQRGIEDVTRGQAEDVLAWVEFRQSQGTVIDKTISRELCIMRTFYNFLVIFCGSSNPTHCLPEFICRPSAEQTYLSVDETFRMLEVWDIKDSFGFRNYVMVALLWSTGLRSRELLALQWRDIDLEDGTVLVRKGKGSKQRQLYLNERMLKDLRRYRKSLLAGEKIPVFCGYPNSKRKGVGDVGLSGKQLIDIVRNCAKDAGIERKVSPMTLRHTFATHMYEAGVPVGDIQEMMGHNDKTETTIYIHVTINAIKRLLNKHVCHTHYSENEKV